MPDNVSALAVELDELDERIVSLLVAHGRMPTGRIAAIVGRSVSSTSVRLRRLVRTGVIYGFHADVDPALCGRAFHAQVGLRLAPSTDPVGIERLIAADPQVIDAWRTTGRSDYQLRLACAGLAELTETLAALRRAGVEETVTTLLLRRIHGADPCQPRGAQ